MIYLTAEQVLFVHARMMAEIGGTEGVRDLGLLQSAVARPQASFEGKELYPDVFAKAAALLESLVNNHPFLDGNKRTGIAAASLFLLRNGWRLSARNDKLEEFTLKVASQHPDLVEIRGWLKRHAKPVRGQKRTT